MNQRARILLFTGDGKGKTTAAFGMVLRAVGHKMRVLVIQFVKNDASVGEVVACAGLPGVEVVQTGRGFIPKPDSAQIEEHRAAAGDGLRLFEEALRSQKYDLIVLDEICHVMAKHLVDEAEVLALVESASPDLCLVMTGRHAPQRLFDLADTVTEMRCIKHGYANGILAQKGVER